MPSALITGAGGFIGGALARRLVKDGWRVELLVRSGSGIAEDLMHECTVHRVDAATSSILRAVEAAQPDLLFHLASLYLAEHTSKDIDRLIASNVLLTCQLAEAITGLRPIGQRRMVVAGTAWQHFRGPAYVPVNLYAATKQAGDDLLFYYTDTCALSLVRLKLFDTYGAGDTRRKLVQLLVDAALSGQSLGMSPGEQIMDITHVDDVVSAFIAAGARLLESSADLNEEFFVSGERFRVRDLVPLVEESTGRRLDVNFGERAYRAREVMEPIVPPAAKLLPGWRPRRRLAEAVATLAR